MDVKKRFFLRKFHESFARRGSDAELVSAKAAAKDKAHNNRHGPERQRSRPYRKQKQDRSGKKRTICIQCREHRALTNLAGWSKQLCTTCAQKASITFPPKKILNKRKAKRKEEGTEFEEKAEKDTKGKKAAPLKKKQRPAMEIQKEQEPLEKPKRMWTLKPQDAEFLYDVEDSEDSEASKKEDTKKGHEEGHEEGGHEEGGHEERHEEIFS